MQSFIKEYSILSEIDHPNIINILEIWEWEKMLFIVTEYCYGGHLFEYVLERNKLEESEVREIMS
jgi:serine/threonine protein kinase